MKLYNFLAPLENRLPVVASLPHSGTCIPRKIRKQFSKDPGPILAPVDWHLDKLYSFLPELGITVLQATHSRYVVNLNRDLQPPLFGPEQSSVISEATCFGKPLYDGELDQNEIEERINRCYLPYHRRLTRILNRMVRDFGRVYLLDLHSYFAGPPVDICLGNVNETTCSEGLIGSFERSFRDHDFTVTRNEKWIGGYITRHYGSMDNVECLQMELWFPSYLEGQDFGEDETIGWDSDKFRNAKMGLRQVFSNVVDELF